MNIIPIIICTFIIYFVCRYLFNHFWDKNLSVNITLSQKEVFEGEKIKLYEEVINRKLLPIPLVMLKFSTDRSLRFFDTIEDQDVISSGKTTDRHYRNDVMSLSPYQKRTRTIDIQCDKRGFYNISTYDLVYQDLVFSVKKVATHSCSVQLFVYPKVADLKDFSFAYNNLLGDIIVKRLINEDPFEFKGIREYQSFDLMKNINWKASARLNNLMVNQHDFTANLNCTILLNLESRTATRNIEIEEASISLAARFIIDIINSGISARIITNASHINNNSQVIIDSGNGKDHISAVLRELACIDASKVCMDFCDIISDYASSRSKNDYAVIISTRSTTQIRELVNSSLKEKSNFIIPYNKYDNLVQSDTAVEHCSTWFVED